MTDIETLEDEIKRLAKAHEALAAEFVRFCERYDEDFEKLAEKYDVLAFDFAELNKTLKELDNLCKTQ